MSRVAVVSCDSYEYDIVIKAVNRGMELLGGPGCFMKKGEKILLKPNMLSADPPEKCSTTHFSVFKAVAEVCKNTGATISYGDSPGMHTPEAAAKKCGISDAAAELDIKLADFRHGEEADCKEGRQVKKFVIAKGVLESDGIVSIPKLKTHGLARITGCIKNQFGCIPGKRKGEFHVKLPDVMGFSRMLIDLNLLLRPRLFIMDGVYAMEGNGPRGGRPRKTGVLLFSDDPVALDTVVCRIVNLKPDYVPTIRLAAEGGLGTYDMKNIELLGDRLEDFIKPDFDVVRQPVKSYKPSGLFGYLWKIAVPKPHIMENKCVKCGVCANMCPVNPKAVDWHDGDKSKPPAYMYKRCIRCYCCQEMCPESAIELKRPFISKLLFKQ